MYLARYLGRYDHVVEMRVRMRVRDLNQIRLGTEPWKCHISPRLPRCPGGYLSGYIGNLRTPHPHPHPHPCTMSADQACVRCRRQKRRCDKVLPCCTLCKRCVAARIIGVHADQFRLNKHCDYLLPAEVPRLLPVPDWADLTPSNVCHTLEVQVSSIVGDRLQVQAAAAFYFRTIHTWFPIISEPSYNIRLSNTYVQAASAPSDLSLLTLCIALVCKGPIGGELPLSTRSIYTSLKSFVALLEAMGTNSLEMLQSRLLLTVFEIGHAIYPSAYISTAANMRAAVSLGINATCKNLRFRDPRKVEEARQTWRGIVITDRSDLAPRDAHQMISVLKQGPMVDMSR